VAFNFKDIFILIKMEKMLSQLGRLGADIALAKGTGHPRNIAHYQ
jgi:hypothetical protein